MSASAEAIVTAGLRPELFVESGARSISRVLVISTLVVLVLGGFAFRARGLSVEGLADDELNKLEAAADIVGFESAAAVAHRRKIDRSSIIAARTPEPDRECAS